MLGGGAMNRNSHCEVRAGSNQWKLVPVDEARALGSSEIKRCPKCHGRVVTMKAGGNVSSHFEHRPKHDGCELSHKFDGTIRPNPNPLE